MPSACHDKHVVDANCCSKKAFKCLLSAPQLTQHKEGCDAYDAVVQKADADEEAYCTRDTHTSSGDAEQCESGFAARPVDAQLSAGVVSANGWNDIV